MVFLWIGVGIGILLVGMLIRKYVKTPKYNYVNVDLYCKTCGDRTNGFKCPLCENKKLTKNS